MTQVAALSILALTVTLSLSRPTIGAIRIHHSGAAVIGALLALATGVVPPQMLLVTARLLLLPIVTIVSLMVVTLIAEQAGVFEAIASRIASAAAGDARKLFAYLFFTGTLTGMIFTNDAAVLIFTPLVFNLIEQVSESGWTIRNKIPYYFAVLYVANLVGALVISNPINIIVSSLFGIEFVEYAMWMILPAAASVVVTFTGLRFVFRHDLPLRFHPVAAAVPRDRRFFQSCTVLLGLTLAGFFSESLTGVATWLVALTSATVLSAMYLTRPDARLMPIVRAVGWDVIVFVVGVFVVSMGLRNAGLTHQLGELISAVGQESISGLTWTTGVVAALCSSVMNNHPTADTMSWVIRDFALSETDTKVLAFSALIGGDLGPKMLPIGSLAALMWFRILRDKGVDIPYSLYVRVGVPVTLAAVVLSIAVLNLEYAIVGMMK